MKNALRPLLCAASAVALPVPAQLDQQDMFFPTSLEMIEPGSPADESGPGAPADVSPDESARGKGEEEITRPGSLDFTGTVLGCRPPRCFPPPW